MRNISRRIARNPRVRAVRDRPHSGMYAGGGTRTRTELALQRILSSFQVGYTRPSLSQTGRAFNESRRGCLSTEDGFSRLWSTKESKFGPSRATPKYSNPVARNVPDWLSLKGASRSAQVGKGLSGG